MRNIHSSFRKSASPENSPRNPVTLSRARLGGFEAERVDAGRVDVEHSLAGVAGNLLVRGQNLELEGGFVGEGQV